MNDDCIMPRPLLLGVSSEQPTLRDRFAVAAMQSFAALSEGYTGHQGQIKSMCDDAYLWADAMLEARKTGGTYE